MPLKPSDKNTDTINKPAPDTFGKKERVKERPSYPESEDVNTNYGFSNRANIDTAGEETEEQEYAANGLPAAHKYSVDKVGRSHDEHSNR